MCRRAARDRPVIPVVIRDPGIGQGLCQELQSFPIPGLFFHCPREIERHRAVDAPLVTDLPHPGEVQFSELKTVAFECIGTEGEPEVRQSLRLERKALLRLSVYLLHRLSIVPIAGKCVEVPIRPLGAVN
jgi:hypothetical protein